MVDKINERAIALATEYWRLKGIAANKTGVNKDVRRDGRAIGKGEGES